MTNKLYILDLKYDIQIGRICFEGDGSEKGEKSFTDARKKIPNIGENSSSYEEFVKEIIKVFSDFGFTNIRC